MNFTRLENNIIDVIKEEQMKLGYRNLVDVDKDGQLLSAVCSVQIVDDLK